MAVTASANKSPSESKKGPKFGCRHVQVMLLCASYVCGYSTRSNLSVAIVAMTDNTTSPNPDVPTYHWTNSSVILSSFFWTYITFQVVAASLGKRYGPKYFLLVGSFINFCACAATPISAAKFGWGGVMFCRIIQGLSQGFFTPSIQGLLGCWVPKDERATLNSVVSSGVSIGGLLSSILTGYIAASWWGWTWSFYLLALLGFIWCALWWIFGSNSPLEHPRISEEEKTYIQKSLKQEDDIKLPTPWKKIFTCVPFYAAIIAWLGHMWCHATLMTETPTYFSKVMNFNMKSNAIFTSLPVVLTLVASIAIGALFDCIVKRNLLTATNARKISHVVGSYGQAACLIGLSFLSKSQAHMSVALLSLGQTFSAFHTSGANINHLDLSPRFSGVLFGILNACGHTSSILAPLAAQWVITDGKDVSQWRTLFLGASGYSLVCATIFFFYASANRQEWDGPESELVK